MVQAGMNGGKRNMHFTVEVLWSWQERVYNLAEKLEVWNNIFFVLYQVCRINLAASLKQTILHTGL